MERHEAWAYLVDTRVELLELLNRLDLEECTWAAMVIVLDKAVDLLHRACEAFEYGDAAELHEDIYLPLFDALSHLTQARYRCNGRGIRVRIAETIRRDCELARDCFEASVNPA